MKKTKEKYTLVSTVSDPGKEFIVGEDLKDTTFLPNSLVMSSFIHGVDENNPNIGFHQAVMFRRGKSGKPSIKVGTLLAPIYHIKELEMKFLYPDMDERKHFISLEELDSYTDNIVHIVDTNKNNLDGYIKLYAWLLSKATFLKALDNKSRAAENETAAILGPGVMNRPKVLNKHTRVKNVLNALEESITHEEPKDVWNRFISEGKLSATIMEIRSAEHMLSIPKNYYIKSINGLMYNSLQYIKDKFSKADIENKRDILNAIVEEQKSVIRIKEGRDKTTKTRLKNMKNNQVKLTGEEDIF